MIIEASVNYSSGENDEMLRRGRLLRAFVFSLHTSFQDGRPVSFPLCLRANCPSSISHHMLNLFLPLLYLNFNKVRLPCDN